MAMHFVNMNRSSSKVAAYFSRKKLKKNKDKGVCLIFNQRNVKNIVFSLFRNNTLTKCCILAINC